MEGDERARDRRLLPVGDVVKATKWPRTPRRRRRIEAVLRRRQPDLTVVLENVHDPHNVSAVLRSCDAVGILRVHLVYSVETPPAATFARTTSASAAKWIETVCHESIDECYGALRGAGFRILATALTDDSLDLYDVDWRSPAAVVFGNEMQGVSAEALGRADGLVCIPMLGMVESLNVSVACAVTLFEALRQRRAAGCYDRPKLDDDQSQRIAEEWLKR